MATSRTIKLTARYAYEACVKQQFGQDTADVLGWNKEPHAVKEGWYKAAKLWAEAEAKAMNKILAKISRKPRAK